LANIWQTNTVLERKFMKCYETKNPLNNCV